MAPHRGAKDFARPLGRAAIVIALVAIGFMIGRGSGADSAKPASSPATTAKARSAAPAVLAYLRQQVLLGDPSFWLSNATRRSSTLRRVISSPELRRSVERSIASTLRSGSPVGLALRSGRKVLARSIPIGYRLLSEDGRATTFDIWVFSLLGGQGIPLDLRLVRYRIRETHDQAGWRMALTKEVGEGSAVRFRGAPGLSTELAEDLDGFEEIQSEP